MSSVDEQFKRQIQYILDQLNNQHGKGGGEGAEEDEKEDDQGSLAGEQEDYDDEDEPSRAATGAILPGMARRPLMSHWSPGRPPIRLPIRSVYVPHTLPGRSTRVGAPGAKSGFHTFSYVTLTRM